MIAKVVIENGVKKLVPLASGAQIGSGLPLGTIIPVYSNVCPSDYLPCNGVAFDENQYPALYNLLGDNHTPYVPADLGADWDNKQAIPITQNISYTATESGWIFGSIELEGSAGGWAYLNGAIIGGGYAESGHSEDAICLQFRIDKGDVFTTVINATVSTARSDLYFVPFKKFAQSVIKATSGLETGQQEYVLQALNEAGSYSTEEVATGKKWIDGKLIYKKSYYLQNVSAGGNTIDNLSSANIDNVINIEQTYRDAGSGVIQGSYFANSSDYMRVLISQQNWDVICHISTGMSRVIITIFYTKTTN